MVCPIFTHPAVVEAVAEEEVAAVDQAAQALTDRPVSRAAVVEVVVAAVARRAADSRASMSPTGQALREALRFDRRATEQ